MTAVRGPVALLAVDGASTYITYNFLKDKFDIAGVVIEDHISRYEFVRRRAAKLGWFRVVDQLLFRAFVVPWLTRKSRQRASQIADAHELNDAPITSNVHRVKSANSDECIAALQSLAPRVVVVCGTRILGRKLLESVNATFINMHAGITPLYRGVHGGYWALVEGDRAHCGVTVHLVDTGIDTGGILYQTTITTTEADNFSTYPLLQLAAGLPLLERAVRDVLEGRAAATPAPSGQSRLWTHPGLSEYWRNWRRTKVR
jgi:folate-dependent phosphoribosylglycinamide formyltransferase PurN